MKKLTPITRKVHFSDIIFFHKIGMSEDDKFLRNGIRDRDRFRMRIHYYSSEFLDDILKRMIKCLNTKKCITM